jgi:transcriptional regulator with XRE-family HTH domain
MKQPEIGKRLNEIRIQKGITQKELSDLCSVDIRTIQRIEAGDVEPRMSTLKILAAALETEDLFLAQEVGSETNSIETNNGEIRIAFSVSLIAGIFYFFNFILYSLVLPNFTSISGGPVLFLLSVIHIISGGLFFMGFVFMGRKFRNNLLFIFSIVIIILIPVFVVADFLARITGHMIFIYMIRATVVMIGITGVMFGMALIKTGNTGKILFTVAGIIQIIENVMFLVPVFLVQNIGLWLAVPGNFILLLIIYTELQKSKIKPSGL